MAQDESTRQPAPSRKRVLVSLLLGVAAGAVIIITVPAKKMSLPIVGGLLLVGAVITALGYRRVGR
jgi:hypothetical protein